MDIRCTGADKVCPVILTPISILICGHSKVERFCMLCGALWLILRIVYQSKLFAFKESDWDIQHDRSRHDLGNEFAVPLLAYHLPYFKLLCRCHVIEKYCACL